MKCRAYVGVVLLGMLTAIGCGAGARDARGGDAAASGDGAVGAEPDFDPTETAIRTGHVSLPAGLGTKLDELSVQGSAGTAKLGASGDFVLTTLAHGSQLAIVLSPMGNPMLMGWLDAGRSAIDAHTTAEVLIYFAAGGPLLPPSIQMQAISAIAKVEAAGALANLVATELVGNVEAFAIHDQALEAALIKALASPSLGVSMQALIRIEPGVQSGVMLNQDEPAAFHATNTLRRRGHVFVERVMPDPSDIGNFEVPPVSGLNGGVFGALIDIINAHFGNQATAYGPVDAPNPPFSVPVVGDMQTTYRVTLVGPAAHAGSEAVLTAAQNVQLTEVSMRGFATDALVPFVVNAVLGSGVVDFAAGQKTTQAQFYAVLANSIVTDLLNLAPQVPGLVEQIRAGAWKDALLLLWTDAAGSNTLRTTVDQAIKRALVNSGGAPGLENASRAFSAFNVAVNAAGGLFQAFDSAVYAKALLETDRANQWTLDVLPSKVKLTPADSTIAQGAPVDLKATVVDVTDVTGYTYHWKNTGSYGMLQEINGPARKSNDYCSSSPLATYVPSGQPQTDASDTVTVEVFPVSRCAGNPIGSAVATIHVKASTLDGRFFVKYDKMLGFTIGPVPCAVMFLKVPKASGAKSYDVKFENYGGGADMDHNNNTDLVRANPGPYTLSFLASGDRRELAYDDQCYDSHGALAGFAVSPMQSEIWVAVYMSFQPIELLTGKPWNGLDLAGVVTLWSDWLQNAKVTITPKF